MPHNTGFLYKSHWQTHLRVTTSKCQVFEYLRDCVMPAGGELAKATKLEAKH